MLSVTNTAGIFGIDGYTVTVECSSTVDNYSDFEIVGLPDAAVREAKQRVSMAVVSSGLEMPQTKITVNLAPANIRKEGSAYDLAIFTAVLMATGKLPTGLNLENTCFLGELSFSGQVRSVRGVLPMVIAAKEAGQTEIFVPAANAAEAAVVEGVRVYAVETAVELLSHLFGKKRIFPTLPKDFNLCENIGSGLDFSDVKGQERAKRAMEIAAAGGHNVLMIGPPGSGKSMLAKLLPTILPPMTFEEAIETTKIHSVSGLLPEGQSLITRRPFRSPHHTASAPALAGGGKTPQPGEISLADNGVLFLDELPEFPKNVTESLRQPLEDGKVTVTRTSGRVTFPSKFMLICAMNPCKCGYYGSKVKKCTCKKEDIKRYLSKISGPLLDRIDIQVEMPAVQFAELSEKSGGETSDAVRQRVIAARNTASARFAGENILCNSQMNTRQIRRWCELDENGQMILEKSFNSMGMSARGYDRILRVARTIADLDGCEKISAAHIAEAIQLRSLDRKYWE